MNNSARNRVLLFIIGVLVLTNMAILVYFLWIKPAPASQDRTGGRGREGLSETLKREVGFNDQQVAAYRQLKDQQWPVMKTMFEDLRHAKDSLFVLLTVPGVPDSTVRRAADRIAERQRALDMQAFNHFRQLRQVCRPDQLPRFDTLVQRMFRRMTASPFHRSSPDNRPDSHPGTPSPRP
ncbi:MAG TPA: hypothetical protein VG870_01080 [Chitinophagaceae bacterium]|nr:hypothetical protein [Chitinophagaceae bacterium]